MKCAFIHKEKNSEGLRRLILFFLGWGMDERPFASLSRKGYDILVVWDYRESDFSKLLFNGYDEICVVGWSFGVVEAARFISHFADSLPITRCVAVAGTLSPVDDQFGIPRAIFEGTLQGLSERNLQKFYRRMFLSGKEFQAFSVSVPQRGIEELSEELKAISERGSFHADIMLFDAVYIPVDDRIIPAGNQKNAWSEHPNVHFLQSGHMPDFTGILENETVDKGHMAGKFAVGSSTYDDHASAQRGIAQKLLGLWKACSDNAGRCLEIGVGTGTYTGMFVPVMKPTCLTLWDIADIGVDGRYGTIECCDAEIGILGLAKESYDTITGASAIQWFNSPGRFIKRCRKALSPGGICVFSTFGPDTFVELAPYQDRRLQYMSEENWSRIALRYFSEKGDEVSILSEKIVMEFDTPRLLLDHLRLTGVNAGGRSRGVSATKALLSSGTRTLTYQPVYLLFRKGRG